MGHRTYCIVILWGEERKLQKLQCSNSIKYFVQNAGKCDKLEEQSEKIIGDYQNSFRPGRLHTVEEIV